MEPYGSTATAMLVGAPEDVGERPDAATVTVGRDEIEEALASDAPLELILSVGRDATTPQDVRVAWQRSDLETVLAGADAGGVTFSFDRAELARALEQPDFEGHGIREMVLLTVAAASASAAMAASTASGQILEGTGGGGAAAALVAPGHGEATTARDLAAASAIAPGHDEASTAGVLAARRRSTTRRRLRHGVSTRSCRAPTRPRSPLAGSARSPRSRRGMDEASTASSLASIAGIHDEATLPRVASARRSGSRRGDPRRSWDRDAGGARRGDARGPRHRDACGAGRRRARASSCRRSTPAVRPRSAGSPARGC